MVRIEKWKNSQNQACLLSLLCHLVCLGYFGGNFLTFCFGILSTRKKINLDFFFLVDRIPKWKSNNITAKVPRTHQMTKKRKQASFILQILEFFYPITIIGTRPATIHRCIGTSRYFLPRYEYRILNKLSRYNDTFTYASTNMRKQSSTSAHPPAF